MANLIRSELHQFLFDYIKNKKPELLERKNGSLANSRSVIKAGLEESFQHDQSINPEGRTLREFFAGTSQENLQSKLAKLREQAQLRASIPLGQWVSLAESIVTHDDDATRNQYAEMFQKGMVQSQLRENLRFKNQYEDRDLHFLIHNQSSEVNRSVVEIVSNAIDFSPLNGTVTVNISEHGYQVRDLGKGMDPQNLIEELSIPFISGARDKDKDSIGKFGMGFLTILRHLKNEGDTVKVETGKDDTGYLMVFFFRDGKIWVSVGTQQNITQGTRISLTTSDFEPANAQQLLSSHLQYKRGATILVNGENISQLEGIEFAYTGESSTERAGLGYEAVEDSTNSTCEIILAINGVQVLSRSASGLNLPKRVIVDLPYRTNLSESRDVVVYDEIFRDAIKKIIDQLLQSDLRLPVKVQITNALSEILYTVELQAFTHDESVLQYLEQQLSLLLTESGATALPAKAGWQSIQRENAVFVNPRFAALLEPFFASAPTMAGMRSSTFRGYTAEIDSATPHPLLFHEGKIVLSTELWKELKSHPQFLEAYINFMLQREGYISLSRAGEQDRNSNSQTQLQDRFRGITYLEDCEKRLLDPDRFVDDRLFQTLFNHKLLYRGEMAEKWYTHYKWDSHLRFGEVFENQVKDYLLGRTESFGFDAELLEAVIDRQRNADIEERPSVEVEESVFTQIRALLEHKEAIASGLEKYRDIIAFFLPENIQHYFELPPEQLEERLCVDFLERYQARYQVQISKVYRQRLKRLEWERDYGDQTEPSQSDIPHDFSFLQSVLYEILSKDDESTDFSKSLPSMAQYHINYTLNALSARNNYLQVKSTLSPQSTQVFDQLFSFHWSRDLQNPDNLIAGSTLGGEDQRTMNLQIIEGMGKVAQVLPPEQVDSLLSVLLADPHVSPNSIYPLLAFILDPFVAYHSITHSHTFLSDKDKLEELPRNLSGEQTGMEKLRSYFERNGSAEENFAWRYRYSGIQTFDQYEQDVQVRWKTAKTQFPNLANKYQGIYGNETIRAIFSKRGDDIKRAFSDALSSQSHTAYESFSVEDAMEHTEGCFAPLSESKLNSILSTVKERFDPDFMDRQLCSEFAFYLRRVLVMTHLNDDEFENLQEWLLLVRKYNNFHVFRNDLFAEPIISMLREKQVKVGKSGIARTADIWGEIVDSMADFTRGKTDEQLAVYVGRLVDIVEDIMSKPQHLQNFIFRSLEKSGASYQRYACFSHEAKESDQRNSLIQPYIIYFHQGERTTLEAQNRLFSNVIEDGEQTFLLSDLMHSKRTRSKHFTTMLQDPEQLPGRLEQEASGKNKFVYNRELIHSIQHLPANDTYLFLRELIQNSYDASATDGLEKTQKIEVDNYRDGELHVVQISDSTGMDFEKLFSTLLIPNVSSKAEGSELGRFGVGFMSIFKDAERVEIMTANGQQAVSVAITPVKNTAGHLTDLQVSYSVNESVNKGTIVRKYFATENGQLESAKIQAAANKYGAYLDADRVQLSFGKEMVNTPKRVLAHAEHDAFGSIEILEGEDHHLLQGRLYVNELPSYLLDLVPAPIKDIVLQHGLIVNLDPMVQLTRSRKDLAQKKSILPDLQRVIPGIIIEAVIQKFAAGKFDLSLIPYDYFWSLDQNLENWRSLIDPQTVRDADNLNQGQGIENWLRYSDRHLFLELVTLIQFIEIDGEKRSLQEISELHKQGVELKADQLPERIQDLLKESTAQVQNDARLKQEFSQKQETQIPVTVLDADLMHKLQEKSDAHLAFLDVVDAISTVEGGILHGYYNLPEGSNAVAAIQWKLKAWNLLYNDYKIAELSRIIRDGNLSDEVLYKFLSEIIDTSTHEDSHIELGTAHWGSHHNEIFWEKQRELWSSLMKKHSQLIPEIRERLKRYQGTCLRREDVAQLVMG